MNTSAVLCPPGGGRTPGLHRASDNSSPRGPKDAGENARSLTPLKGLNLMMIDPARKRKQRQKEITTKKSIQQKLSFERMEAKVWST